MQKTTKKEKAKRRHPSAKLTKGDVLVIRAKLRGDLYSQRDVAKQYGVSQTTISLVHRKLVWKDV